MRHYQHLAKAAADNYQVTYQVIYPNQEVHYLESTAKLYRDDGKPARMAGILIDISERSRAANSRAASEASSSLFQASPDPTRSDDVCRKAPLSKSTQSFSQTLAGNGRRSLATEWSTWNFWADLTRAELYSKLSVNKLAQ